MNEETLIWTKFIINITSVILESRYIFPIEEEKEEKNFSLSIKEKKSVCDNIEKVIKSKEKYNKYIICILFKDKDKNKMELLEQWEISLTKQNFKKDKIEFEKLFKLIRVLYSTTILLPCQKLFEELNRRKREKYDLKYKIFLDETPENLKFENGK
jgi:hypothetical protein